MLRERIMPRVMLLTMLSIAGVLFSGYLSSVRFFTSSCAFSEPCPYFLGYPACYYGFAMFLVMMICSFQYYLGGVGERVYLVAMRVVSAAGVLFAGYFTLREIPTLLEKGISSYILGLPTCAYGLLVFIAIHSIAHLAARKS